MEKGGSIQELLRVLFIIDPGGGHAPPLPPLRIGVVLSYRAGGATYRSMH